MNSLKYFLKPIFHIIKIYSSLIRTHPEGSFQSYFLDFLSTQKFKQLRENNFSFGEAIRKSKTSKEKRNNIPLEIFLNSNKLNHGVRKVIPSNTINQKQELAINRGHLIHEILSKIYDKSDFEKVLSSYENVFKPKDFNSLKNSIKSILYDKKFESIFNSKNIIYNERDFYYKRNILRPDRIEINKEKIVYVLDYKTGDKEDKYLEQIEKYVSIFNNMGYKNIKKYIIYI